MNRGGVETWLMHVLRNIDSRRVRMDFLVHSEQAGQYDEEIQDLGGKLIRCPEPLWSPAYRRRVGALMREKGAYDALHSHVHHFSAYLLYLARQARVPARIAHSHNDTSGIDGSAGFARRCYLRWAKNSIRRNATCLAAVSNAAARALFGEAWQADSRRRIQRCGIDLSPFREETGRSSVRAEFGITPGELVMGHVGRYDQQKNHALVVRIAAQVMRRHPDAKLLLAGQGPLRHSIEQAARDAGIDDRVVFAGLRSDVPRVLSGMDVLLFPSLWEGLPLTVLEAQAAGLPCVISDVITGETDVVPELIHRVPLTASASQWAEAVLSAKAAVDRDSAVRRMEQSSFSIANSIEQLYALYNA